MSAGDGTLWEVFASKFFSGKRIGIGGSSTNGRACCGGKFGGNRGGACGCGPAEGTLIELAAAAAAAGGILGCRPRRPGVPEERIVFHEVTTSYL